MTLVAQQADVLLVLQAKQEALYRKYRTATSKTRHHCKTEKLSVNYNEIYLNCAKHLILHMATAKLFLHCGTGGSIQHLLFHLQPSEGKMNVLSVYLLMSDENCLYCVYCLFFRKD